MVKYFSSGPQFVRETLKWKMPDGALMPEKSVLVGCQNRPRYMQDQPTQSGQLKLGSFTSKISVQVLSTHTGANCAFHRQILTLLTCTLFIFVNPKTNNFVYLAG